MSKQWNQAYGCTHDLCFRIDRAKSCPVEMCVSKLHEGEGRIVHMLTIIEGTTGHNFFPSP